jgi:hypothetical protein
MSRGISARWSAYGECRRRELPPEDLFAALDEQFAVCRRQDHR